MGRIMEVIKVVLYNKQKGFIMENWKDIINFEGLYQVSDLGNVRSLDRIDSAGHRLKGKIRKISSDTGGYSYACLTKNGNQKNFSISRLVANAFIPKSKEILEAERRGEKIVVDHLPNYLGGSGDITDNRVVNLRWLTVRENSSQEKTFKSGLPTGVVWHRKKEAYQANITINAVREYICTSHDPQIASQAYLEALEAVSKGLSIDPIKAKYKALRKAQKELTNG